VDIVLCPPAPGEQPPAWFDELPGAHLLDVSGATTPEAWVAQTALALGAADAPRPLLVATGQSVHLLPRLAFATRAARRPAVGYVLVGDTLPDASDRVADWPDAPVTVVCTEGSEAGRLAALRGWAVTHDDPATAIGASVDD